MYRRASANGIVEILSVYRKAVLHIERALLSDTMPILETVTQGLNKVACEMHCIICFSIILSSGHLLCRQMDDFDNWE